MAVDTETKRRSALGMAIMALVVAPVPDGTIAAVDREHILGIYAGIAPGTPATTAISIVNSSGTTATFRPNHASDNNSSWLIGDGFEVQGDIWAGTASNYVHEDETGIDFNGTARINWTKIAANGATVTGCTTASNVTDLQTNDANTYTCTEVAATPNFLVVDFANVTAFNWVEALCYYDGNSVHNLSAQLEITPFDGSAWTTFDSIGFQSAATNTFENHSFFVEDDTAYINSGVVKVRFLHSATESNGHTWGFNLVALQQ